MNIDRGKTDFSPEEIDDLRRALADYKEFHSLSWDALGKRVGISGSTLSLWVPGKYGGDNAGIAVKVNRFYMAEEARQELEVQAPIIPGFQFTKTARLITEQLRWAHRGKIVAVVGSPGIGKTGAIDQYVGNTPNAYKATMSEHCKRPVAMMLEVLRAVGVTSVKGGSLHNLVHLLMDRWSGIRMLLVVDEAQFLEDRSMEVLRHLNDTIGCGIAMAGNATVLTRVQGGARKAEFAQLYSRLSLPHHYRQPYPEDIAVILGAWSVTHPMEREFLGKLAMQPGHLRTITQVLELATLVARQEDEPRNLSHLRAAWEQHGRQAIAA